MRLTIAQARALGIDERYLTDLKPIVLPDDTTKSKVIAAKGKTNRQPSGKPNKTEQRFIRGLDFMKAKGAIREWAFEPEKFRLADRTWYCPDIRITLPTGQNLFVEVKGGFIRDDAIVKLKVAAESHPYPFFLAVYQKKDGWTITRMPSRQFGWIAVDVEWAI